MPSIGQNRYDHGVSSVAFQFSNCPHDGANCIEFSGGTQQVFMHKTLPAVEYNLEPLDAFSTYFITTFSLILDRRKENRIKIYEIKVLFCKQDLN